MMPSCHRGRACSNLWAASRGLGLCGFGKELNLTGDVLVAQFEPPRDPARNLQGLAVGIGAS